MAKKDWLKNGADGLTFGERLDDLIKGADGTNASRLASVTKIPQSAISAYINGTTNKETGEQIYRAPDCTAIIEIAKYFSVSTDYLLGLSKDKTPDPSAQGAIAYTGLSEENIKTLHDISKGIVNEGISKKDNGCVVFDGNKPFIDCLNDLLEAMYEDRAFLMEHYIRLRRKPMRNETVDFWYVMGDCIGSISGFEPMEYSDPKMQIKFDNEMVEYHCNKIAKTIEQALLRKYYGTPDDLNRFKSDVNDERDRIETLRRNRNGID